MNWEAGIVREMATMKHQLALWSLFAGFVSPAVGCLCFVPETPCAWYAVHHERPTFVGEVISKATVSQMAEWNPNQAITAQKVIFKVKEAFEDVYTTNGEHYPELALEARTGAEGRFMFDRVGAGRFILSMQSADSGMVFYSDPDDGTKPNVIDVPAGGTVLGVLFRFPAK